MWFFNIFGRTPHPPALSFFIDRKPRWVRKREQGVVLYTKPRNEHRRSHAPVHLDEKKRFFVEHTKEFFGIPEQKVDKHEGFYKDEKMKAENIVVGIYGWKGAGKTTALTLFLLLEHFSNFRENLFSNYKLKFDFRWLRGHDMIELTDKLNNSAVGIDELHEYADSRNSGTLQNKRVSDFFLQSRHTRSNVYYTTQFKDQVDKRIRRITDIDVVCENLFTDLDGDGDDDYFKMTIADRRTPSVIPIERKFYAKPVFDLFDSTERINPFVFTKKQEKKWKDETSKISIPAFS